MTELKISQSPPLPKVLLPITIIGAGGIVKDAHLPAYRTAGFPVAAICDPKVERARALASEYGIETVCRNAAEAVSRSPATGSTAASSRGYRPATSPRCRSRSTNVSMNRS